jgi:hypothetical protein
MVLPTNASFPRYVPTVMKERDGSGEFSMTATGHMVGTRIFEVPYSVPGAGIGGNITAVDYCSWLLGRSYTDAAGVVQRVHPDVFSNELNFLVCQEVSVKHEEMRGYEAEGDAPGIKNPGAPRTLAAGALTPNDPPSPFTLPPGQPPNPDAGPFIWPANHLAAPIQLSQRVVYARSVITAKYTPLTYDEEVKLNVRSQKHKGVGYGWAQSVEDDDTVPLNVIAGQDISVIVPNGDISFCKRHVLCPPFFSIMKLLGRVNSLEFLGYPQYMVLFAGCDGKRAHLADGTPVWDLHFKFLLDPQQHARKFRPGPGGGGLQYVKVLDVPQVEFTVARPPAGTPVVITAPGHGLPVGALIAARFRTEPLVFLKTTETVAQPLTDNSFAIQTAFNVNWDGTGFYTRLDSFPNLPADLTPLLSYR